jgi:TRAP-type uncharacterized transport system substrate-binding protein
MAAACPHACPWGELGEFVRDAAAVLSYDVLLCTNCNRAEGPRIVAAAAHPPPLLEAERALGATRIDAPVDFGVTESGLLAAAYDGRPPYDRDGPHRNLRLIAQIEDPTYLLIAVRESTGITDLAQIRAKRMPVRIASTGAASAVVLDAYGLDATSVRSWGGSLVSAMQAATELDFDVLISDLASPANNPESAVWSAASQRLQLRFLELPAQLLTRLSQMPGEQLVTARWGLLRGVDRAIHTVGRSGEAIFCRADTPEQAAYDLARAIDAHRDALKWYVRPYSYDPRTVWRDLDVPLSPGAERYYREQAYLR